MVDNKEVSNTKSFTPKEKNSDALILEKAFHAFGTGCEFSKEEREQLEQLDALLKNASIIVSKDGSSASIAMDGEVIQLRAKPKSSYQSKPDYVIPTLEDPINEKGNADSKILYEAYKQYTKDGVITKKEAELIEKMDEILKHSDIEIGKDFDNVAIIEDTGRSFSQKVNFGEQANNQSKIER